MDTRREKALTQSTRQTESAPIRVLQRKCVCGAHSAAGGECGACAGRQGILQRRASVANDVEEVPPIVHEALSAPGRPLDGTTRSFMESRLGRDFSGVRIHADARAAESARAVNALAYTVGRNVVFGEGQYAPETSGGRRLIAHELAHVAQQAGAATAQELRIGEPSDRLEHEADQAAHQIAHEPSALLPVKPAQQAAPVLRRAPAPVDQPSTDLQPSPLGASMAGSITIDRFEFGKADLTEEHKKKLAEEAATINRTLKQFPDSFVSIVGHADAVGADERNVELGQKRAESVLAELQANGVPADVMRAASLGESSLLVKTQEREPRNRRVEIFFNARRFHNLPLPSPTPELKNMPGFKLPPTKPETPKPENNIPAQVVVPKPVPEGDKDKQVEFKLIVEAELKREKKEGEPAETKPSSKIALELTIKSGSLTEHKGKRFEVSFGEVEASAALGLEAEKEGKKVSIKGTSPMGVSFTIVEIKTREKLPFIPKGVTFELKVGFEVDPLKSEVKAQSKAQIKIPLGKQFDIFLGAMGEAGASKDDKGVEKGAALGVGGGLEFTF